MSCSFWNMRRRKKQEALKQMALKQNEESTQTVEESTQTAVKQDKKPTKKVGAKNANKSTSRQA